MKKAVCIKNHARPVPATAWCSGLALIGAGLFLAGCTGFPQAGPGSYHPTPAELQATLQAEDRYIYFPHYEIYYNRTQGYYVYRTDLGWVDQFDPPKEVDLQEMLASPSAEMNFNDSPALHHPLVVREYPRSWGRAKRAEAPVSPAHSFKR